MSGTVDAREILPRACAPPRPRITPFPRPLLPRTAGFGFGAGFDLASFSSFAAHGSVLLVWALFWGSVLTFLAEPQHELSGVFKPVASSVSTSSLLFFAGLSPFPLGVSESSLACDSLLLSPPTCSASSMFSSPSVGV